MLGEVKWFDEDKGFGFICQEDGSDIFVHYSHILQEGYKSLSPGDKVKYDIVSKDKGKQARNVVKLIT